MMIFEVVFRAVFRDVLRPAYLNNTYLGIDDYIHRSIIACLPA